MSGGVVRPATLRDLAEPGAQEIDDIPGDPGLEFSLLQAGVEGTQRVVLGARLAEVAARGVAEQIVGAQEGIDGEPAGGFAEVAQPRGVGRGCEAGR